MTETQATSGTAGTSTNPVEPETEAAVTAAARSVGRATVPATESPTFDSGSPKYTRAPGMPPPPDAPPPDDGGPTADQASLVTSPASVVTASATVPVVTAPVSVTPPISAPPFTGTGRPGGIATGRVSVGTMPGRAAAAGMPGVMGAARVTEAVRTARGGPAASRGPRRARLTVKRVDPWSVMKFSLAVSVVLFIVIMVATSVLYLALDAMGVFESVNSSLTDLLTSAGGGDAGTGFKITFRGVIGVAGLLGAVNVVLVTALATLSAFIYNVCADLVGGVELTLSERD